MDDHTQYLTQDGMASLEKRLRNLTEVRRPQVAERLRLALEEGGELTENSEYEDAKNEQAFIEGEIARLELILNTAELLVDGQPHETVVPGARVTVVEGGSEEIEVFQLVGSAEVNPREGKISTVSPLGRELMGKRVGDRVRVQTPDGTVKFTIKAID